jgi:uncharacterized damage-inducible protein DinB
MLTRFYGVPRAARYHLRVNFQSLFAHQAWADASLLSAIHAHPPSQEDEWLQKTLLHMVGVQRYFLSLFLDRPFDREKEAQPPASFADLVQRFRATHEEELIFVGAISEADLERRFELPFLKTEFTVADGLTQVVMHSQNHRGQCLRYLRKHGAEPPTLDYILWAKDRPAPAWPEF